MLEYDDAVITLGHSQGGLKVQMYMLCKCGDLAAKESNKARGIVLLASSETNVGLIPYSNMLLGSPPPAAAAAAAAASSASSASFVFFSFLPPPLV